LRLESRYVSGEIPQLTALTNLTGVKILIESFLLLNIYDLRSPNLLNLSLISNWWVCVHGFERTWILWKRTS